MRCSHCGRSEPEVEFYPIGRKWKRSWCKGCNRTNTVARYAHKRAALDAIKLEHGCVDCGYRDHPAALEFDHLPGFTKLFGIGNEITRYSLEELLAETLKCEVVCANCHRVRSANRKAAEPR